MNGGVPPLVAAPVIAFLLGSIPFGLIFGKGISGIDPRTRGSGNIGFTNVLRVSGKVAGFLTLLGDIGKGLLAVFFAEWMFQGRGWEIWLAGFFAVLGHMFSVFLNLRGGKGVATGLGVVLALNPIMGGILTLVWGVTVLIWRYSSLGAIAAFVIFPFLSIIFLKMPQAVVFSFLISAIILYKHSDNITRLRAGTEPKMGHS